jgi:hypothetical protein
MIYFLLPIFEAPRAEKLLVHFVIMPKNGKLQHKFSNLFFEICFFRLSVQKLRCRVFFTLKCSTLEAAKKRVIILLIEKRLK